MEELLIHTKYRDSEVNSSLSNNRSSSDVKWVHGIKLVVLKVLLKLWLLVLIMQCYKNPKDWISAVKHLLKLKKNARGEKELRKMATINGKYYMGLYTPALFTKAFDRFIFKRLHEFKPNSKPVNRFDMVFISATNYCPLRCEHCYNWNHLKKKSLMTSDKLNLILNKLQNYGVSHIQFTGGEPILEINKICEAVKQNNSEIDYWITTSGFLLDSHKAEKLKSSGITGVIISLDHHDSEKHNEFRGHKKAYYWVEKAIENTRKQGLLLVLSICITKEFATIENLERYMDLAKQLGAVYVQFLEPKPVGHYKKRDVSLSNEQLQLLEKVYLKYNTSLQYETYPIIIYPSYYQRRTTCALSGNKGIYIDAYGQLNPCPYCQKSFGDVLGNDFELNLQKLVAEGCSS